MSNHSQVYLRTATKLDTQAVKTISSFVTKKLGHSTELDVVIDPQLIAGFKLNIEGVEYDHSLAGAIESLSQEL